MSGRKIEEILTESSIPREATLSKCLVGVLKESDELAKQCNVEVDVLIVPPAGKSYIFKSSCPNSAAGHSQNLNRRREISSFTLKQARILKSQQTLNKLMKELERENERVKVLKKRQEEFFQNYERMKSKDSKMETLIAFNENLKALQQKIKHKIMEMEASSSQKEE